MNKKIKVLNTVICFSLIYFLTCQYFSFDSLHPIKSYIYFNQHKSINNVAFKQDSNVNQNHLHINSYTVKDKNAIYADSLLTRYSNLGTGNRRYIDSYSGSHGVILYTDGMHHVSNQVLFNTGLGYTDYNQKLSSIINYANKSRILAIHNKLWHHSPTYEFSNEYLQMSPRAIDTFSDDDIHKNVTLIKNIAPSESYGSNIAYTDGQTYIPDGEFWQQAPTNDQINGSFNTYQKYITKNWIPIYCSVSQNGSSLKEYYLNGQKLSNNPMPFDFTSHFVYKPITAKLFYRSLSSNVLYSNGNARFLQYMYRNEQNPEYYRLIDAYKRGYHLNPLVFNIFVRADNTFCSPYSFNYNQNDSKNWHLIRNNYLRLKDYINSHNYNFPANYDEKHYYYRTLEGTLIRDNNIRYVNQYVKPMIMGNPAIKKKMPTTKRQRKYYNTSIEFDYAKKFSKNPLKASQQLNFQRCDGGFEPLWMIGLINDKNIGTYHPGEIVCYNDQLTTKHVSRYFINFKNKKLYLPVYRINNITCFKAIVSTGNQTKKYVRAKDAYMLLGEKIHCE